MNSYHSPIILTPSKKKENNPTLVNNATDWEIFKKKLEGRINLSVPLRHEQQLGEEVETFINNIQQAAWENTPGVKRRTAGNNYPKEIKDVIAKKRKLRSKCQQFRYHQD